MRKKLLALAITGSVVVSAMTGCANTTIANHGALDQQAREMATNAEMTPDQAILAAANGIKKANEDELHFYAPLHLEAAKDALNDAQKAQKKGEAPSLVLEKAFLAKTQLEAGYENKAAVESTLSKSLEQRNVLDQLDVPNIMPKAYAKSLDKIVVLVKDIEGGEHDKALAGEAKVLEYMVEVEIDTLKKVHLTPAESMMDKADSVDADKFAEQTYEQAEAVYDSSESFIEKSYRDREGVKHAGLEALNAAAHSYYVAKESQLLVGLNPETSEQRVLVEESLLARINQVVGIEQLNTMSLYDQSVALASAVERIKMAKTPESSSSTDDETETARIIEQSAEIEAAVASELEQELEQAEALNNDQPKSEDSSESGDEVKEAAADVTIDADSASSEDVADVVTNSEEKSDTAVEGEKETTPEE